mmetsp:Transcript_15928/g.27797  ORF Transcript_15928/g.27797 Transcript_15928/m.27797 type:complete len:404 (-) Transcript_15928:43-1254(-)
MMERNMPDPHDLELIQADFDKAEEYVLPASFVPGKWDVICQRGKECFEHVGNRRFRMAIDNHLDSYMKVKSRQQKSKIVTSIVEGIKKSAGCNGGGFIRKDLLTRRWFRVSDKLAREKVGQALRDAIKTHRALNKKASPGKAASFEKKAPAEVDQLSDPKKRHQQHGSSSNSINHSQISSAAGPLNPSDIMPLVPFMESKSFADIEPRPVSLPLNLNEFLSGTFLNQSVEVAPTTANEQQNLFLLNRTQQDAEAKRNILHNSPVVLVIIVLLVLQLQARIWTIHSPCVINSKCFQASLKVGRCRHLLGTSSVSRTTPWDRTSWVLQTTIPIRLTLETLGLSCSRSTLRTPMPHSQEISIHYNNISSNNISSSNKIDKQSTLDSIFEALLQSDVSRCSFRLLKS